MVALFCLVALILDPMGSPNYTDPTQNTPKIRLNPTKKNRFTQTKTAYVAEFDTSPLDSSYADPATCYDGTESVIYNGVTYSCEGNYLTDTQKELVVSTFSDIKEYLNKLLLVEGMGESVTIKKEMLSALRYFKFNDITVSKGTDIVINVYSKPHSETSSTLAAATYIVTYKDRPIVGYIILNPRAVPETDTSKRFFWIALHETLHALGISSSNYDTMHSPTSDTKYSESFDVICSLKQSNDITRYFLVTPYAHAFAVRQYGTDTFTIGSNKCPSGIEVENLGGSGTALAHPKNSMAFSDVMAGVIRQETSDAEFLRLTTLTAAWILDTGDYEIDWSNEQVHELLWGYKETFLSGQTPDNYPMGAKQNMFPEHYGWSTQYYNSFDFRFYSSSDVSNYLYPSSYLSSDTLFTNNKDYFNPQSQEKFADAYMDYVAYVKPRTECASGTVALTLQSGGGACVSYTCDSDYSLKLGTQQVSVTTGGTVEVDGSYYIVPNGEYICRTVAHSEALSSNPFSSVDFNYYASWSSSSGGNTSSYSSSSSNKHTSGSSSSSSNSSKDVKVIVITVVVIAGVICATLVSFAVIKTVANRNRSQMGRNISHDDPSRMAPSRSRSAGSRRGARST